MADRTAHFQLVAQFEASLEESDSDPELVLFMRRWKEVRKQIESLKRHVAVCPGIAALSSASFDVVLLTGDALSDAQGVAQMEVIGNARN